MHVIVTGGAGFIGSQLVAALAAGDPPAQLTVIDDFSSGHFRNLRGYRGDVIAEPCEKVDWKNSFGKRDIACIYHLASITDTTVMNQRRMIERNVEGFRSVLRFASSRGVPVVYASSAATYGQVDGLMQEDQGAAPANVYGFSKAILDNLAVQATQAGSQVVGLRYFNVYGPHEAHKGKMASMVYQLYKQISAGERPRVFRHGEQLRDFVYVKDVVAGTLLAGQLRSPGIYNLGSGKAASFNEIISWLQASLGTSLETDYIDNPYSSFYQNHTEADLTKSRSELGYEPQWIGEKGVADYVRWLQESGA
jgi:ADP-L-glycero-D-manno-heptose 6-epimerase